MKQERKPPVGMIREIAAVKMAYSIINAMDVADFSIQQTILTVAELVSWLGGHDHTQCSAGSCISDRPEVVRVSERIIRVMESSDLAPQEALLAFAGIMRGFVPQMDAVDEREAGREA